MQLPEYSLYILNAVLFVLGSHCSQALATLPGSSGVSFSANNSGAARYEVPILIPPGTKAMQPDLSLVYTNRCDNGIIGIGWSLKGVPSIRRCPADLKTDEYYQGGIHHDVTDGYCLTSQRLIAVDGVYGDDGTEYRTEVESYTNSISRGYAHEDICTTSPKCFEVFTIDGKQYTYDNRLDSRTTPMWGITVHSWLLRRVEERWGNYYSITYSEEPETWHLPLRISYTSNLDISNGWWRDDRHILPDLFIDNIPAGGVVYGSFVDLNGDGLVDRVRAFRNPGGIDSIALFLNIGKPGATRQASCRI